MTYSEHVIEEGWEPTPWPPEVRACAVPDVLPVTWFVFWTAVVAVALGMWVARIVVSRQWSVVRWMSDIALGHGGSA